MEIWRGEMCVTEEKGQKRVTDATASSEECFLIITDWSGEPAFGDLSVV